MIAAADARLACFDGAADRIQQATAKRDIVVMDRQDVARTRRSLFGFTLPSLRLFGTEGSKAADEELTELEAVLRRVSATASGGYTLQLEQGGSWQSTEAWRGRDPRAGDKAVIRKATLGSYTIRVGDGRSIRVRRID